MYIEHYSAHFNGQIRRTFLLNPFMPTLQDPIRIGDWELPNRVIMAPLTRCRSSEGRVPNDLMRQYYQQRASAGLIISEATSISPMAVGYPNTPGIWSPEQITGWRRVTDGVHSAGGRILLQLWHVGRVSDPFYLNGALPVAREVGKRGIAFICVRESLEEPRLGPELKRIFGGPYIANELFTKKTGEKIVEDCEADAVAYGRLFIANPDLPRRLALNAPLNEPIQETFYASVGAKGYTDYPALDVEQEAA